MLLLRGWWLPCYLNADTCRYRDMSVFLEPYLALLNHGIFKSHSSGFDQQAALFKFTRTLNTFVHLLNWLVNSYAFLEHVDLVRLKSTSGIRWSTYIVHFLYPVRKIAVLTPNSRCTVCPRISYPFYMVNYYIKWVTILLGHKVINKCKKKHFIYSAPHK